MNQRLIYTSLLFFSVCALLFAYLIEYMGHFMPCTLCVYQRFPYLLLIFIPIIALSNDDYGMYNKYIVLTISCSILLSGYHSGIELGFFDLSKVCKPLISIKNNMSVDDFQRFFYSQDISLCNKAALIIFGFSMTQWNFLVNILLLIFFVKSNDKAIFSR